MTHDLKAEYRVPNIDQCFCVLFFVWLGGKDGFSRYSLFTIQDMGKLLEGTIEKIPRSVADSHHLLVKVNLKDEDAFHLTIEEYLQALITLVEELVLPPLSSLSRHLDLTAVVMQARLATNSVVLEDYDRPKHIARFVKEVHAGFQILNLKNDSLRRRSDGIKYQVKKVEEIMFELSIRELVPKDGKE